jgi:hypothetical protein
LKLENSQNSDLQQELEDLKQKLYLSEQIIQAMKSSKFWFLRQMWFKLKEIFGLSRNEQIID